MTVALLGDVHGDWSAVILASQRAAALGATALIQVGDLGWSPSLLARAKNVRACIPVYAIDGNHDDFGWLIGETHGRTAELTPGLTFVARGDVREMAGLRIGFLGGAESVDKAWRKTRFTAVPGTPGEYLWWPEERIAQCEAERLAAPVDLLVTHTPPDSVIRRHFAASGLMVFGIDPTTWTDPSALVVERAWNTLDRPQLICGHMHRSVTDERVQILDINELLVLPALSRLRSERNTKERTRG